MSINLEDHIGLAYDVALKWHIPEYKFPAQDRISVALYALTKASTKFDPTTGNQFSSYATVVIKNHLSRYYYQHCRPGIRIPPKRKNHNILDMPTVYHDDDIKAVYFDPRLKKMENEDEIRGVLSRCTPLEKTILDKILQGKSRKEIAKELKFTRQHISGQYVNIIKREKERLNENAKNSKKVA